MKTPIDVLIVDDSEDDALLIIRELDRGGFVPAFTRIDTLTDLRIALAAQRWDIVLADHSLPRLSAPTALMAVQQHALELPVIIVSGTISETTALTAIKVGARDYIPKDQLNRLAPVVWRELRAVKEPIFSGNATRPAADQCTTRADSTYACAPQRSCLVSTDPSNISIRACHNPNHGGG